MNIFKYKISKILLLTLTMISVCSVNNAIASTANNADTVAEQGVSEAELAQILAPIALYPDVVLSHIFIASTYPLEVISADRWLKQHKGYSKKQRIEGVKNKPWDESVKILVAFPSVIERLSADIDWMQQLGDVFLIDQVKTLAMVQELRQQAETAGNLSDMDNVRVVREEKTIIIEPAEPEVIYIPYYDTRTIYGHWRWSHRPPVYWHRPVSYVHYHHGFYWHNPVQIHVGLWFGHIHWHNRYVEVRRYKRYKKHSHVRRSTSYESRKWRHDPIHRKGVSYRSKQLKNRYAKHHVSENRATKSKRFQPHKSVVINKHNTKNYTQNKIKKNSKNNMVRHKSVIKDNKHLAVINKKRQQVQPKVNKHKRRTQVKPAVNKTVRKSVVKNVQQKRDHKQYKKPYKQRQIKRSQSPRTHKVHKARPKAQRHHGNKAHRNKLR